MAWRSSFERPLTAGGRRAGIVLLVALLGALLVPHVPLVDLVRLANFDAYQALAPRIRASEPAIIVAIDDPSLSRHGQWPWPRSVLAALVARVTAAQPAAVGFDIVMPEPDRLSPDRLAQLVAGLAPEIADALRRLPSNESVLAEALRHAPTVLGAAGLDHIDAAVPGRQGGWTPMRLHGGDPTRFLRRFAGALRSVEEIDRAARGRGLLNADREGGVVRRVPLIAAVGDVLVPGFAPELLRVAAGHAAFSVDTGGDGVRMIALGDLRMPTERDGSLRVHYSRHDARRFVSAADVIAGKIPAEQFAQKIVLIGVTAVGLSDYTATPVADRMAGAEIHAQVIENLFDGSLLRRPSWAPWAEAGVLAALGLVVIFVLAPLSPRSSLAVLVAGMAALWLGGAMLYHQARILIDVATPTIALGTVYALMVSLTLADARRQLRREREAAARLAGELEGARRIQMGLVPRPHDLTGHGGRFELAPILEPARAVGGDLYDFFELGPDRLFFSVGDVAGKGLPGCLFMAVTKSHCKSAALRLSADVAAILTEANRETARDNPAALFVTLFAGILDLDTGLLEFSNAGHEAPYVLRRGEAPRQLPLVGGLPLCVMEEFPYAADRFRLAPGDMLCVMTDGVPEAHSPAGELYGRARLETLLRAAPESPAALAEALRADVARFTAGAEPADDLAILVLRWNGSRATPAT